MIMGLSYREEYEQIRKLQAELPNWVSRDHVMNDLLPMISIVAVTITAVFLISIVLIRYAFQQQEQHRPSSPKSVNYKGAYQLTNLLVNAAFGIIGLSYFRQQTAYPTLAQVVVGDYTLYPLACAQLAYNLWAIPVGIFLVKEPLTMIGHHISVILVTCMGLFLPLGYRYFAPFMFGILETSSVPLAMVNVFKDNPEYIQRYPTVYTVLRFIFLFSFLYVRWWMYLPIKCNFLRLLGMGILTYDNWPMAAYCSLVWIGSLFVFFLQIWWGYLILKALVKFMSSNTKGVVVTKKLE